VSKTKLTLTLNDILPRDVDTFRKACEVSELNKIEILSVVYGSEKKTLQTVRFELMASPEDLFWAGRWFERLSNRTQINLSRPITSVRVNVPEQLFKLCHIIDVPPQEVLQAFANDVGLTVHGSSGSDERNMAVDYFKRAGHGMHLFEPEEIDDMFDGLEWIRYEWRNYGNSKEEEYRIFFEKELKEWFTKWRAVKNLKKLQTS
jgi:hypothetical protein